MKKKGNQDIICSLIFIMGGIYFLTEGLRLGRENPETGVEYFPNLLAITFIVLNTIYLIKSMRNLKGNNYFKNENKLNKEVFYKCIFVIILFIILWPYLPFVALSSIYLIVLGYIFGADFRKSIMYSLLTSIAIYYIFSRLFHVMLN